MPDEIVVSLPNGGKVVLEVDQPAVGLGFVGLKAPDLAEPAGERFAAALHSLAGIADVLEASVSKMVRRPDKVEIEFSASLSGTLDLKLLKGDAEAEFKVTLTWGKEGAA